MTLALPYVFEVPAGPKQNEAVDLIRRAALRVCRDAKIEAAVHPLGMVRVRLLVADAVCEERAAAYIIFAHIPHQATVFAQP